METSGGNPPGPSAHEGLTGAGLRYVGSVVRHLEALFGLFQVEAREAAEVYLKTAVFVVLGLLFLVFGYVFFLLFAIFLVSWLTGIGWMWITLLFGFAHFGLVAVCAWRIREGIRHQAFEATLSEIRKDVSILRSTSPDVASPHAPFER